MWEARVRCRCLRGQATKACPLLSLRVSPLYNDTYVYGYERRAKSGALNLTTYLTAVSMHDGQAEGKKVLGLAEVRNSPL